MGTLPQNTHDTSQIASIQAAASPKLTRNCMGVPILNLMTQADDCSLRSYHSASQTRANQLSFAFRIFHDVRGDADVNRCT